MSYAFSLSLTQRRLGVCALLVTGALFVVPVQWPGPNQNTHLALTRSLVDYGTAKLDRTGPQGGRDIAFYHGHVYAAKAPGFAFANVPAYAALRALGLSPTKHAEGMLWSLGLLTVVLPSLVLLFLVRHVAEQLAPGYGTIAAVTLGLGTIVFPFATLFFSHALSTLLGFAAFVLLWRERRGKQRLAPLAAAGLTVGLAVSTEFPNVLLAGALGVYAVSRAPFLRRGLLYATGVVIGVLPVVLYDWIVFGSPLSLPYAHNEENRAGFFGLVTPSVRSLAVVLLSRVGLLTLTPVIAVGIAGTILLYRRGDRIEALLIWTICAAFVLYDTAYWLPLGGATPGPRFLMPILPFLAIATALSFERMPLTASVLAVPSIAAMLAVTITHPILAAAGGVVYRLRTRDFTDTVFTSLGIGGANVTAMVLVLLAAGAIALALAATPRPPVSQRGAIAAVSAALAWLVTALAGHEFVGSTLHQQNSRSDSLAALAVAGAASFVVAGLHKHALVPDAAAVAVGGSWRKDGTKAVVR